MADKRRPTYNLEAFQVAFSNEDDLCLTGTALRTATALGFGRKDIVVTIQAMQATHFYKSMTSQADNRIWQDVYHVPSFAGVLYVKFTADAVTEFLLLSFKEREHG